MLDYEEGQTSILQHKNVLAHYQLDWDWSWGSALLGLKPILHVNQAITELKMMDMGKAATAQKLLEVCKDCTHSHSWACDGCT